MSIIIIFSFSSRPAALMRSFFLFRFILDSPTFAPTRANNGERKRARNFHLLMLLLQLPLLYLCVRIERAELFEASKFLLLARKKATKICSK